MTDHVIRSGVSNDAYRENWERIFGKAKRQARVKKAIKEVMDEHHETLKRLDD